MSQGGPDINQGDVVLQKLVGMLAEPVSVPACRDSLTQGNSSEVKRYKV